MDPAVALALVCELYETVGRLTKENLQLRAKVQEAEQADDPQGEGPPAAAL